PLKAQRSPTGRAIPPGAYRRKSRGHLARLTQTQGMGPGRLRDPHPASLARRRNPRHRQDAPRTRQSHPQRPREHEDTGPPDGHRHEPEKAGGGGVAAAPFHHRKARSKTNPGLGPKQLLQQSAVAQF
ncbi:hypothetical protein, partial [Meridianimarinicoccus roseus]|uniref:hypothetical protein n=1 Tax=Meridianimarinicoccus roseus TaxID=2072018 RepID=UPI001EE67240